MFVYGVSNIDVGGNISKVIALIRYGNITDKYKKVSKINTSGGGFSQSVIQLG